MADGCVLSGSDDNSKVQLINRVYTTLQSGKHKENLQLNSDGKVKWLGQLDDLKQFVEDILNDSGKWISPGGKAKSFRNENITITWYSDKKTLLFQGQIGATLKEQIVNSLETKRTDQRDVNGITGNDDDYVSPLTCLLLTI